MKIFHLATAALEQVELKAIEDLSFMQVIDGAKIRGLTTENFFNDPNTGHLPGGILKLKYIIFIFTKISSKIY